MEIPFLENVPYDSMADYDLEIWNAEKYSTFEEAKAANDTRTTETYNGYTSFYDFLCGIGDFRMLLDIETKVYGRLKMDGNVVGDIGL